jgi:hypothetical protein
MSSFTPDLTIKVNRQSSATTAKSLPNILRQLWLLAILFAAAIPVKLMAQAPSISYVGPQTYTQGTAIPGLSPTSTGGAVAAPSINANPSLIGSGMTMPGAMVIDRTGNIFLLDAGTLKKCLQEVVLQLASQLVLITHTVWH